MLRWMLRCCKANAKGEHGSALAVATCAALPARAPPPLTPHAPETRSLSRGPCCVSRPSRAAGLQARTRPAPGRAGRGASCRAPRPRPRPRGGREHRTRALPPLTSPRPPRRPSRIRAACPRCPPHTPLRASTTYRSRGRARLQQHAGRELGGEQHGPRQRRHVAHIVHLYIAAAAAAGCGGEAGGPHGGASRRRRRRVRSVAARPAARGGRAALRGGLRGGCTASCACVCAAVGAQRRLLHERAIRPGRAVLALPDPAMTQIAPPCLG